LDTPSFVLPEHAQRRLLNDEVHARPPVRLEGAHAVVYLAVRHRPADRAAHRQALDRLCAACGAGSAGGEHAVVDLAPGLRLKWEGHAEFSSYTFLLAGRDDAAPGDVLEQARWPSVAQDLPGEIIVAAHVALRPFAAEAPPPDAFETATGPVVGGAIADGRGWSYTDFRIREDGFTRFLLLNRALGVGQAGRMVQRLLEIETYRMMALAAFPVARDATPELAALESGLGGIVEDIAGAAAADEARLLDDLTHLAARVERLQNATSFRFQASEAYDALVQRRIAELRETIVPGLQTVAEFMQRRLAPAMATCRSTERRLAQLAGRVSRASALLRTRVDIAREKQNQQMLAAMNRRGRLQLRLQQAVEGLSVVVITYYGVSLVGVFAKALKAGGLGWNVEMVMAASAPVIALAVFLAARGVRRALHAEEGEGEGAR